VSVLPGYYSATAQEATLHSLLNVQPTHAPAHKYAYIGLLRLLTLSGVTRQVCLHLKNSNLDAPSCKRTSIANDALMCG
jgi:hypothetical protein